MPKKSCKKILEGSYTLLSTIDHFIEVHEEEATEEEYIDMCEDARLALSDLRDMIITIREENERI